MDPRNFRTFSLWKVPCGDWPAFCGVWDAAAGWHVGQANKVGAGDWARAMIASESDKAIWNDRRAVRDDLNAAHPGPILESERQAEA